MGESLTTKMGEVSLDNGRTPFGKEMLKHFLFDPNFKNLNQGDFSHSTIPYWNIDIYYQAPLVASPVWSARSSKSTGRLANSDQTHSSAMTIQSFLTSLEQH